MNWALILVNAVVFLAQFGANPQFPDQARFIQNLVLYPQHPHLWQFVTYAFLHASWMHLIGNMLFLYIFGNNINDRLGHLGYLAFYLAGAVFAGTGYAVIERHAPVLGASGAVAAVTGAYLMLLPRSNVTIFYFIFFIGVTEIASLWFILLFFAMDVFGQLRPTLMGGQQAVAYMAHISGTLFGATVSFGLLAGRLLPRDQFDVVALLQRWNRRRQYRDMVSKGYDPFGYTPRSTRQGPPDPTAMRVQDLRTEVSEAIARRDLPGAATKYQELLSLDPTQFLSRQAQLDVSNQLASQQQHAAAAAAYELFLKHYPNFEQIEQVQLMLGVVYARYLGRYDLAKKYLLGALARLHKQSEIDWAKAELARIEPLVPVSSPGAGPGR
jgi:membrane associated rhomboid family serine protease